MPLPSLQQKVFKTKILSTQQEVNFRPYTIGEQKLLMLAKDRAKDNSAEFFESLIEITGNCVSSVNLRSLYIIDLQRLFYDIKSVSAGNVVNFTLRCKNETCVEKDMKGKVLHGKESPQTIDTVNDLYVENPNNFKGTIEVPEHKLVIRFEQPKVSDLIKMQKNLPASISDSERGLASLPYCLKSVSHDKENFADFTIEEAGAWIDSISDPEITKNISEFFAKSPALATNKVFKCPHCGHDNTMSKGEVQSFFT